MRVRSLGWEDPLEKEKATRSSTHAWEIPWTEEPGGLQSTGLHTTKATQHADTRRPTPSSRHDTYGRPSPFPRWPSFLPTHHLRSFTAAPD